MRNNSLDSRKTLGLISVFLLSLSFGMVLNSVQVENLIPEETGQEKPNIIIIDIDRFTESHMSCQGYPQNTTPNICAFGEKNVEAENAISQSGWTGSSLASLFTGQYMGTHGLHAFNESLPNDSVTMAEILKENGYSTAAFPSIRTNHQKFMVPRYNLNQGFERYGSGDYSLNDHNPEIARYVEKQDKKPFFLFVQSYLPHEYLQFNQSLRNLEFQSNYSGRLNDIPPRAEGQVATDIIRRNGQYQIMVPEGKNVNLTRKDIDYLKTTYDSLIHQTDDSFANLIRLLKESDEYSNSIIIFTANHGEVMDTMSFSGSERFGHGLVYEDMVNVPLMMHIPGRENSMDIERQLEFVDILPTIMDLTGSEYSGENLHIQGESFAPLITESTEEKSNIGEGLALISDYGYKIHAVRNNTWKYIKFGPRQEKLFNLKKDPEEHNNVIRKHPKLANHMEARLEEKQEKNRLLNARLYE